MGPGRVEAFSDGVLAVAITLLALNLHVDVGPGHPGLMRQLGTQWPAFAAYLVSFFVIGVIWVNHHALLALAVRADRDLMFDNLLLLLFVVTIPFTTATFAGLLRGGGADTRGAVVLYGLSMTGMAVGFTLLLHRMLRHDLLRRPVPRAAQNRALARFGAGTLIYPALTAVGLAWAPGMLVGLAALTGYYMLDQTPILGIETSAAGDGADTARG